MDLASVNEVSTSSKSGEKISVDENQLHYTDNAAQPTVVKAIEKGGDVVVEKLNKNEGKVETDEYRYAKLSVWWDTENCSVPKGFDPNTIAPNITSALRNLDYSGSISIYAYGDTRSISTSIQHAMSSTGISLNHVPADVKDACDKRILVDMLLWAVDNPAPANYLLISGDRDFSNALHQLRMRRYNILLAQPSTASAVLVAAAKTVWLWTSLVNGCPPLSNNKPPLPKVGQFYNNKGTVEEKIKMSKVQSKKKRKFVWKLNTQICQVPRKKHKGGLQTNAGKDIERNDDLVLRFGKLVKPQKQIGEFKSILNCVKCSANHPGRDCKGNQLQFEWGNVGFKAAGLPGKSAEEHDQQFSANKSKLINNRVHNIHNASGGSSQENLKNSAVNGESGNQMFNMDHAVKKEDNHAPLMITTDGATQGGADNKDQVGFGKPKRIHCRKCGANHQGGICQEILSTDSTIVRCIKCGDLGHKHFQCNITFTDQQNQQFLGNKGISMNSEVGNVPTASGNKFQKESNYSAVNGEGIVHNLNTDHAVGEGNHTSLTLATNKEIVGGADSKNQGGEGKHKKNPRSKKRGMKQPGIKGQGISCDSKSVDQPKQQILVNVDNLTYDQVRNTPIASGNNVQQYSNYDAKNIEDGDVNFSMDHSVGQRGIHTPMLIANNDTTQGGANNSQMGHPINVTNQAQATSDNTSSTGLLEQMQSVFQLLRQGKQYQ